MIRLQFLTLNEAAERVGRTRRTIERWIADGVLKVDVLGGQQHVREDRLLRALRDQLVKRKTGR